MVKKQIKEKSEEDNLKLSGKTNNGENTEKELDKKTLKQTMWFFSILILLLIALFAGAWINFESKKFDYIGLTFQKEKFGEIPIYTSQITGYGVTGLPMNFKLVLRNNPTELDIPIEGNIMFLRGQPVYLSINSSQELESCGDGIALISFGYFMTGLGFDLKTGAPTQELANSGNQPLINCDNTKDATVLILTEGNETKIIQHKDNVNCYTLSVSNCETIPLMEKFEIATLSEINGKPL